MSGWTRYSNRTLIGGEGVRYSITERAPMEFRVTCRGEFVGTFQSLGIAKTAADHHAQMEANHA